MRLNRDVLCPGVRIRLVSCATLAALTLLACGGGGGDAPSPPGSPPVTIGPPGIASFTPAAASVGSEVTISGINFANSVSGNTVRFNGADATVVSASSMALVAVVPAGATTGPLQVSTAGGSAFSSGSFTVLSGTGAAWRTRTFGSPVAPQFAALAHNGTRFVNVGSGGFAASLDARLWTLTSKFNSAHDVVWNGQLFVAVGNSSLIYTSPDGLTWTLRTGPTALSIDLSATTASPSTLIAVGEKGTILSSSDGTTWTERTSGTTKDLVDVTWTGNRFVAVGAQGAVVTSTDGASWTLQAPPTPDSFTAVGATPSLIVAATFPFSGSQLQLLTSSDGGVTWTTAATDLGVFNEIIYAGGRFVAAGFNTTATSVDGVVWTTSGRLPAAIETLLFVNNEYVAVGGDGNNVTAILTSSDALTWKITQSAHSMVRVARSPADGRLVAVGDNSHIARVSTDSGASWTFAPLIPSGENYPFVDLVWSPSAAAFVAHVQIAANQNAFTSSDGVAWVKRGDMPCQGALAASPTQMVNVGASLVGACISVSTDAASWSTVTPPSSTLMKGVFWTGTQFVGVGNAGLIATSPDGLNWTLRSSGVTATLLSGTASGSTIVVIGSEGAVVTSNDGGATWAARSSGVTATLNHAVFTGSEFFAVGSAGIVLRSATGESWVRQPTPYDADLGDILWLPDASRLVLVGATGLAAISP
jgi:IPT/TIG domain